MKRGDSLIPGLSDEILVKWEPVFENLPSGDALDQLQAMVYASMDAKWKVNDLVEIWIKPGATLGMITHREYRTTLCAFVYTVLADGELYERCCKQIYKIGEAQAPFIIPPMKVRAQGLMSQEILKVQPMTQPVGLLFHLDYNYGDSNNERRDSTHPNEECAERSIPPVQEEEQGLWGRICGLWSRWRSSSPG